jgi:hypothetical protein
MPNQPGAFTLSRMTENLDFERVRGFYLHLLTNRHGLQG